MSIVPHTRQPAAVDVIPLEGRHRWMTLLAEVGQLAHAIANTDFVPKTLRGNEAAVCAAILYGDEVGLSPMQALAKIAVIDGKPTLAAEGQRALILAAGHFMWLEESTATKATWAGKRADNDQITRVTWTMDDARKANLAGKHNWRTYPRQMLQARASAELARAVFADVIGGLAATEELEDVVPDATAVDDDGTPPAPAPTTRRRRATKAAAPAVAPVPPPPPDPADEPPLPDEAPPAGANDAQLRKMFALFNERGITDRDDRLDWTNQRLDRTVVSASELTDAEASTIIDALEELADTPAETPDQATQAAQQPLGGEALISADRAGTLLHFRRESKVDESWMRNKLITFGVKLGANERVGVAVLRRLTKPQANELQQALSDILDARIAQE